MQLQLDESDDDAAACCADSFCKRPSPSPFDGASSRAWLPAFAAPPLGETARDDVVVLDEVVDEEVEERTDDERMDVQRMDVPLGSVPSPRAPAPDDDSRRRTWARRARRTDASTSSTRLNRPPRSRARKRGGAKKRG